MTDFNTASATSFSRMDESLPEQWDLIFSETSKNRSRVAVRILQLLRSLSDIVDGFAVDQLTHCLQTATRAEIAGADTELVVASLCHDIGKAISVENHPRIAAEILRPYVRDDVYCIIGAHQDFQGRHYYELLHLDPNSRDKYCDAPWFGLAEQFADEWDQVSFDPLFPTQPLEHFEEMVYEVFKRPRRR